MQPLFIHALKPSEGGIFIDNLTVCGADRLLHSRYAGIDRRVFSNPVAGITIFIMIL